MSVKPPIETRGMLLPMLVLPTPGGPARQSFNPPATPPVQPTPPIHLATLELSRRDYSREIRQFIWLLKAVGGNLVDGEVGHRFVKEWAELSDVFEDREKAERSKHWAYSAEHLNLRPERPVRQ
ncbi:hypothetical protein BDN72DRAFT_897778 [Pluteus cervinus]|uniref:Uncharacterized protein n=1 Tax=Pluteus cervinus TaxID=181527 RepID=A0ACD3ATP6_9AGAR|nr:hypothetical protein BDN72DRAFT_897778 [Pluteus cervinus]